MLPVLEHFAKYWMNVITGIVTLLLVVAFIYTELNGITRSQEFNFMIIGAFTFFFGMQAGRQQTRTNGNGYG